jgi:hypothetical protein
VTYFSTIDADRHGFVCWYFESLGTLAYSYSAIDEAVVVIFLIEAS